MDLYSMQTRLLREPLREKYQQTVDGSRLDYSVPFIVRAVSPHGVVFTYVEIKEGGWQVMEEAGRTK